MTTDQRIENYMRQNRHWRLTPAQVRRADRKLRRDNRREGIPNRVKKTR